MTSRSSPRAIRSSSTTNPRGSKITSTSTSPSQALSSQPSGGVSAFMPASTRACSARSASEGFTTKSRSCRVSGPPRAQTAREPASRAGIPASRKTATQRLRVASMSANGWSGTSLRIPTRPISMPATWVRTETMPVEANGRPGPPSDGPRVKIAAAGDMHCSDANREQIAKAFADIDGTVDLILLAGDLTTHGQPEQGRILADACRDLETPVFAVLGNHDWQCDQRDELVDTLEQAGIAVLDPGHAICRPHDIEVGIVGTKGFMGGFPGSHVSNFGEPSVRAIYAEATREVEALEEGLRAVATCPVRIVLLHYAPTEETLKGEPEGIWTFLGTDRLAAPIAEHEPDLVLHGHAHAGTFEGRVGDVPVFNVSVPVMGATSGSSRSRARSGVPPRSIRCPGPRWTPPNTRRCWRSTSVTGGIAAGGLCSTRCSTGSSCRRARGCSTPAVARAE